MLPLVLCLPLLLAVTNCYTYVPTRVEDLSVGTNVRALVSTSTARSLEERIGIAGGSLSGKLLEHTDSRLLLLVRGQGTGVRIGSSALYQRVDVAVPDVLRVEFRVLNKVRTGGLVAALLGVATVMLVQAFGESGPGSDPGTPNPVE